MDKSRTEVMPITARVDRLPGAYNSRQSAARTIQPNALYALQEQKCEFVVRKKPDVTRCWRLPGHSRWWAPARYCLPISMRAGQLSASNALFATARKRMTAVVATPPI